MNTFIEQQHTLATRRAYLVQTEAAELLRVSGRTLERWRLEGTGPAFVRFGRRVVYATDDLHRWAAERTFSSTSEADAAYGG